MGNWQDNFTAYTTGFAFALTLSRDQASLLAAISDRGDEAARDWSGASGRQNFIPVVRAIERRGLVEHNPAVNAPRDDRVRIKWYYRLTPAGRLVLELIRISGAVPAAVRKNEAA